MHVPREKFIIPNTQLHTMSFIIIYTTCPDKEIAKKISDTLLNKKLIACANMFSIESAYWWLSNIEKADEVVCLMKTTIDNWEAIKKEIKSVHPYETPCIAKINAEANKEYEDWIEASLGK